MTAYAHNVYVCFCRNQKYGNDYSDGFDCKEMIMWNLEQVVFFVLSVIGRSTPYVTLVFVTGERCACKNRRRRYQFPIRRVNKDTSNSFINTDISYWNTNISNWNTDICINLEIQILISNTDIQLSIGDTCTLNADIQTSLIRDISNWNADICNRHVDISYWNAHIYIRIKNRDVRYLSVLIIYICISIKDIILFQNSKYLNLLKRISVENADICIKWVKPQTACHYSVLFMFCFVFCFNVNLNQFKISGNRHLLHS